MTRARSYSKKREAILEAMRSTDCHPSAEWVYHKLKSEFPDLSLGTVYRNIALFREDGTLVSVGTVNGQERFDADLSPHPHLICSRCNAVIDVRADLDTGALYEEIEDRYGGKVDRHEVIFHGLCKNCIEAE